jgi:hypothetical protein
MDITKKGVIASAFCQFRNPANNMLMTDDDGKAVGVNVFGPGSKEYRAAEAAVATKNIKGGKKSINGDTMRENQTDLLAATTSGFVNFDYKGADGSELKDRRAFYDDVEMAAFREQVVEFQSDYGNFLPNASNS